MLSSRFENDDISCVKLNVIQEDQKARIQGHLKSGRYKFENTPCVVCGSSNFESISSKDRHGLYAPVAICYSCGLVQAHPRMTQKSYDHFYNDGHRRLYVGKDNPDETYFRERYQAGKATFDYLSRHLGIRELRILEVGCGSGSILKYFHDKGASVKGIDLSLEYLEYGKKRYGLNLENTNLFDLPDSQEFDLVIYSDVLEHILNPKEHLFKIKKLLKPNGQLYIRVPGIQNLIRPYAGDFLKSLQNAHVYYFSLCTLQNLLEGCGFDLIEGNENIQSLWKISDQINTLLPVNDYADCLGSLQRIENRRLTRKLLPLIVWCVKTARRILPN